MQCANQNLKQLHVTGVRRRHVQAAIGFGFSLAEKVGFYRPITEQYNIDTQLETALSIQMCHCFPSYSDIECP